MTVSELEPVLGRCTRLRSTGQLGLAALKRVLAEAELSPALVSTLGVADPDRPYGRRVLHADEYLEIMLAVWTPGQPCAPHDHGGSVGGVRVVQGEAVHRIWRPRDGQLVLEHEERVQAGDVLACGPDLVHSMADGGAELPLATLHLYAGPIGHMVVYDAEGGQTLVVEGGCGAWLPWDQPELIRAVHPGLRAPSALA